MRDGTWGVNSMSQEVSAKLLQERTYLIFLPVVFVCGPRSSVSLP